MVDDGNSGHNYTYTFLFVTTGVIIGSATDGHRGSRYQALRRHDERDRGDTDDHLGQSGGG